MNFGNVRKLRLRHYKVFWIVGITIISFQILFAILFFSAYDLSDTVDVLEKNRTEMKNLLRNNRDNAENFLEDNSNQENIYRNNNFETLGVDLFPNCVIRNKEAVSAITRAKSHNCKQIIADVVCLNNANELYHKYLSHSCPSDGLLKGRHLGCYQNGKFTKLLTGARYNFTNLNTPQYCINKCIQSGFPYAGIQFGEECFCGNEEPLSDSRLPDSLCNHECSGNREQLCGGYSASSVFETGVAKFSAQIANVDFDKNSSQSAVKIVFLLTLNGRAVRQILRLIKILFHKDHFFYIHVDARQQYLYRELLFLESRFSNIRLSRDRYNTIWGGASLLTMLLQSMKDLIQSSWDWDFVINLSESDFPIKTNEELVEFLSANRGRNFLKSHGRDTQHFIQKQGLDKTFVECDDRMWRVSDRILPSGIVIDGGSDWFALFRNFVEFVVISENDELVNGLKILFKYTLLPAESFFHIILRNTPFCNTYVNNNLHVTNWKRHLGCKCQYRHVVDWCGCSPNAFKSDDWLKIQRTRDKRIFFARKFEPIVSQSIIQEIENWLYGKRSGKEIINANGYWQNIYHYVDSNSSTTDDSIFSVASSLARISANRILKNLPSGCLLDAQISRLSQVHSYHKNDEFMGILVEYEITINENQNFGIESWISLQSHYKILKPDTPFGSRIVSLFVNTNYDVKEQMSRNFLASIGPFSDPVLIYQLTSSTLTSNVTLLWIDPTETIAAVIRITIPEQPTIDNVKSNLVTPLLPGIWRVNLICSNETIAEVKFLVSPLENVKGVSMIKEHAKMIHKGSSQNYKIVHDEWKYLLSDVDEIKSDDVRNSLKTEFFAKSSFFALELKNWIDSLVTRFYKVMDTCVIGSSNYSAKNVSCGVNNLILCQNSDWSSYASDPKSEMTKINEKTGKLN